MAVLEENRIGQLTPDMEEFRGMVKAVLERNMDRYRYRFCNIYRKLLDRFKPTLFITVMNLCISASFQENIFNSGGPAQPISQTQLQWKR